MKIKNKGYIVPVAIAALVVASLGLLLFSRWGSGLQKTDLPSVNNDQGAVPKASNNALKPSTANDNVTLDADSANIGAQMKVLDSGNSDVDDSLNDTSLI